MPGVDLSEDRFHDGIAPGVYRPVLLRFQFLAIRSTGVASAGIRPLGDSGARRYADQGKYGRSQCRSRLAPGSEVLLVPILQH